MKITFLFLFFFISMCFSQEFKEPKEYSKVLEVKGDLNEDGVKEIVTVYNTNKEELRIGFKRVLYIFEIKNNKRVLLKKNTTVLWNSKDCGFCNIGNSDENDPIETILIKNNTLIIKQKTANNSRRSQTSKLIFRFQHNDWYLIGTTFNYYDTCLFDYLYDINFSTNKIHITKDTSSCDENDKQTHFFHKYNYNFKKVTLDSYEPTELEIKKGVHVYY